MGTGHGDSCLSAPFGAGGSERVSPGVLVEAVSSDLGEKGVLVYWPFSAGDQCRLFRGVGDSVHE